MRSENKSYNQNKVLTVGSMMFLSFFVGQAMAIQATSVNPIQGRAPIISDFDKAKDKVGLTVGDKNFNKDALVDGKLPLDGDLIPGDLTAGFGPLANGDLVVTDADGDAILVDENGNPIVDFELGLPGVTWKKDGVEIPAGDLASKSLCDLGEGEFSVSITGVLTASSTAGKPSKGSTESFTQEYVIDPSCSGSGKILFLRPKDSTTNYGTPDPLFTAEKGFETSVTSLANNRTFPSVGFKYAQMYVDIDGDVANFDVDVVSEAGDTLPEFEVTGNKIRFMEPYLGKASIVVKKKVSGTIAAKHDFEIKDWFSKPNSQANESCAISPKTGMSCAKVCSTYVETFEGKRFTVPEPFLLTNAETGTASRAGRRVSTLFGEWGNIYNYDSIGGETVAGNFYSGGSYVTEARAIPGSISIVNVASSTGARASNNETTKGPVICWVGDFDLANRPEVIK